MWIVQEKSLRSHKSIVWSVAHLHSFTAIRIRYSYNDFCGRMYEDDYVDIQLPESEVSQKDVVRVFPIKCLSYSSGSFKNGAVGLCSIGVTSCLNPLLQTLYMYKEFTDILCQIGEPDDHVPTEKRLPYELLALFEKMQDSREDAVPPYRVLCCLRMLKVTLFAQNDVADVFSSFWNHLLRNMPDPQLEEKMRSLFSISLEERLTCQRCRHRSSAHRDLLSLPLGVAHSKYSRKLSLERALRRYFHSHELFEDENFCANCEKGSRANKVTRLRSLPRTFTIHLKRFSKTSSQSQKINRTVPFPPVLDLLQVLNPENLPEDERPTTHYNYRLFAVVAHSGTATFGHFSSYIRSRRDGRWYFFNDSCVCKVSWDDVICTYGNTAFHWGATASLLVYIQSDVELNAATSGSMSPF
ncbi:LOW QUALITY PROTEIN: ubl carboxyl-terminal hydrolase 18 [Rhinoderma darwinii]|uniref:LOW QUALITY PROTEIN: ubl carboxyl-terminal hydrolase 18 n=1 Tax=Rhinoderma darwinii TaxID=43563 RepID=UPI003F6701BD